MYKRSQILTAALLAILLTLGVACMARMSKARTHGKLSGLALTTNENQMSGTSLRSLPLAAGESVRIYVRGLDPKGTWFTLPPTIVVSWKFDKELEITPLADFSVSIKAVAPIAEPVYATASGMNESDEIVESTLQVVSK